MILQSLRAALEMLWNILWALILGFTLSGIIQTFVPKEKMSRLLGRPGPKQLGLASFFGMVSSSCSYAATSMARALFEKGAHIICALAFMLASTNLVIELSVVLWVMMGWQFVVAEFLGGILLILVMAILMQAFGPLKEFQKKQQELSGAAEGEESGTAPNPATLEGWALAARATVMEWQMIWKDILLGVGIAGFVMVLVPPSFWQSLFLTEGPPALRLIENALVGPLVALLSFVCSVGNIPLAQVLFHGGIRFGGAISFIYGDLIVVPILLIYRKTYGTKLALWIFGIFYLSMVIAGLCVDLLFEALNWTPALPSSMASMSHPSFEIDSTFWLNLVFLAIGVGFYLLSKKAKTTSESHSCCH